ncbi:MAG: LAGLIDADG family homing endonuclease, partial [Desulfitobacteriaceae bacterium]|nr:LAGLIDADG family homing endonuclease [Desulfitobacteriaceae bacterium]
PKNFDPKSFVDFKGKVCIIPPNSFVLGKSIEYFKIPKDLLGICLGKCVTADTRMVDVETGAYLPITEFSPGKKTLSMRDWKLVPAQISAFIPQGRKPVFLLKTNAGMRIKATANHPFRQLHGWTKLQDLRPGDRIAIARGIPVFGKTPLPDWEVTLLGLMISEGQCHTPGHSPAFTSSDPVLAQLLKESLVNGRLGTITIPRPRHYRLVNKAGRGGVMIPNRVTSWLKQYGLNVKAGEKFVPQRVFMAPRRSVQLFLRALFSGDGSVYRFGNSFFIEYYSKSRRLIEDVHHLLLRFNIFSLIREKRTRFGTMSYKIQITDREQIACFAREIGFWPGSIKQVRLEKEILPALGEQPSRQRSNFDTLPSEAWDELRWVASQMNLTLNSLGHHIHRRQSVPLKIASSVAQATADPIVSSLVNGPIWDVVEEIQPVGEEEVFDLTVPEFHNFVANGFIVHNSTYARCGIIVNVTPLEPRWRGYITVEISNTTPLPAKIYAGEG